MRSKHFSENLRILDTNTTVTERFPVREIIATEVIDASGRPCLELEAVLDAEVCRAWPWGGEWRFDPITRARLAPIIHIKVPTDYNQCYSIASDVAKPRAGLSGRSQFMIQSIAEDLQRFVDLQGRCADASFTVTAYPDSINSRSAARVQHPPDVARKELEDFFTLMMDRLKYYRNANQTRMKHTGRLLMNPIMYCLASGSSSITSKRNPIHQLGHDDLSLMSCNFSDTSRIDDAHFLSQWLLNDDSHETYFNRPATTEFLASFSTPTIVRSSPLTMSKGSGAYVQSPTPFGFAPAGNTKSITDQRFFDYHLLDMAQRGRARKVHVESPSKKHGPTDPVSGLRPHTKEILPISSHAALGISMLISKVGAASSNLLLFEYLSEQYINTVQNEIHKKENSKFGNEQQNTSENEKKVVGQAERCFRVNAQTNLIPPQRLYVPIPLVAVFGGGQGSNWPFRELLLAPVLASSFKEAVRLNVEVCQQVRLLLQQQFGPDVSEYVNDNGAWCPPWLDIMEPFAIVNHAIRIVESRLSEEKGDGSNGRGKMALVLDAGASHFYCPNRGGYLMTHRCPEATDHVLLKTWELFALYREWIPEFNLIAIIDPFDHHHILPSRAMNNARSPRRVQSPTSPLFPRVSTPKDPTGDELTARNSFSLLIQNLLSYYSTCIAPDPISQRVQRHQFLSSRSADFLCSLSDVKSKSGAFGDRTNLPPGSEMSLPSCLPSGEFQPNMSLGDMSPQIPRRPPRKPATVLATATASISSHYDMFSSDYKQSREQMAVSAFPDEENGRVLDTAFDEEEEIFYLFLSNIATLWILDYFSNQSNLEDDYDTKSKHNHHILENCVDDTKKSEQLQSLVHFLSDVMSYNKIDGFNREGIGYYYGDENDNCYYPERRAFADSIRLNENNAVRSQSSLKHVAMGELFDILELCHYTIRGRGGVGHHTEKAGGNWEEEARAEEKEVNSPFLCSTQNYHAGQQAGAWAGICATMLQDLGCFCIADDILYRNSTQSDLQTKAQKARRVYAPPAREDAHEVTDVEYRLRLISDSEKCYKIPSFVYRLLAKHTHSPPRGRMQTSVSGLLGPTTSGDASDSTPLVCPRLEGLSSSPLSHAQKQVTLHVADPCQATHDVSLLTPFLTVSQHLMPGPASSGESSVAAASTSQVGRLSFMRMLDKMTQVETLGELQEDTETHHFIQGPMCNGVTLRIGVGACPDAAGTHAATDAVQNIGTISNALEFAALCHLRKTSVIVSQCRGGGETEDTYLAHFAVAVHSGIVRLGGINRAETTAKMNEFMRIEDYLKAESSVQYGSTDWQKCFSQRCAGLRSCSSMTFGTTEQYELKIERFEEKVKKMMNE